MKKEIHYKKVIENSTDIIYSVNLQGIITFISTNWTRILGHDIAEVVGHSFTRLVHPDDWERCKKILELVLKNGERQGSAEFRLRNKNGEWRWHSSNISPVKNSEGVVIGGDGVARDITKERNQETRLQKSNTKLKEAQSKLQEKNRFQKILVDISSSFINIPLNESSTAINKALFKIGSFSGLDRVYIFDYNFEEQTTSNTHEWCSTGIEPQIGELQDLPLNTIPDWVGKHKKGEHMLIDDVSTLPDDSSVKQILEPQNIKSLLAIPLMNDEECLGFVGFDAVTDIHQFSDQELNLLKVFASVLVNLHIRSQTEIELEQTNQKLKKTKEKAEQSEERFRVAQENSPDGFTILQPVRNEQNKIVDFIWIYQNEAISKINGTENQDIIGRSVLDIFPEHKGTELFQSYVEVANTGESKIIENINTSKVITKSVWLRLLITSMGEDIAIVAQNVTEQNNAQESLKISKKRLQIATEGAGIGIWNWNIETGELIWSDRAKELFGLDHDVTMSYERFIGGLHPDDRERTNKAVIDALEYHNDIDHEYRTRWPDGSVHWIRTKGRGFYDNNGKAIRMEGVLIDINDRKQAEEKLKLQSTIAMNIAEGVYLIRSSDGVIVYTNLTFERMFGYEPGELIGKHVSIVNAPTDKAPEETANEIMKSLSEKGSWSGEVYNIKKNGSKFWCWATVSSFNHHEYGSVWISVHHDITEQKQAEQALQQSEEQIRFILKHDPNAITVFDNNMNILLVSDRFLEDYDVNEKDIIGKNHYEVFPEIPEKWRKIHQRALQGETLSSSDDYFIRPDGSTTYTRWECRPWYLANGQIGGMIAYTEVITERKLAEKALKESEAKFKSYIENAPYGIFITNEKGEYIEVNKAACNMTGFSQKELLKLTIPELTEEEYLEKNNKALENLNKAGFSSVETGFITKSGEKRFWIVDTVKLSENLILCFANDVTERRSAIEQLKENELRFNVAIEGTGAGIWDWDMINNTVSYSNQWKWMLGYGDDEIENSFNGWKNLWHPNDAEHIEKAVNDHLAGKTEKYEVINRLKNKDGCWQWVMTRGKLLRDDSKRPYRWVGTIIDITSQKEAEQKLVDTMAKANTLAAEAEMANVAKSEFLANMSHEIRTPMNSVVGFSELLQGTELDSEQQQYVDTVITSSKGLLGIINDILDFSKIEAGKLDIEVIETDIIHLVEEAADLVKHPAGQKGLELLLNIDPDIHRFAMVDPVRLRQVLANLLSNALKFTEEGEIELKASLLKMEGDRGTIELSVRDTGIGISATQKKKLFKAFTQADSSTTRKYGGTGLGLVISQQLVQLMGGALEFNSVQGEGSTFYFSIETDLKKGEKDDESTISDINRCLVIDDNENNRTILKRTLKNWGVDCVTCSNGYDSLQILEHGKKVDVLLCDYQMPYLNGLETVNMIRQKLKLTPEELPTVLLHSSAADSDLHEKCKELGIHFRLTKPIKQSELLPCLLKTQTARDKLSDVVVNRRSETKESTAVEPNLKGDFQVLIAEDNEANMNLVSILIRNLVPRAEIIKAINGKEAVEKVIDFQPDIVFMDVQMPDMDGNEATANIRKREEREDLPHTAIVGLTAGALKQERSRSLASGMDDFLTKPIEIDKLKAVLTRYLTIYNLGNRSDNGAQIKKEVKPASEHFDREALLAMLDGDGKTVGLLISDFLDTVDQSVTELDQLLEDRLFEKAAKVAHSIKGASANMRCGLLSELIIKLESEILSEDDEKAKKTFRQVKKECKVLVPILNESVTLAED